MEIIPIEALGYGRSPVPASMIVHAGETDHLGIILPGYLHTVDMPDLHYAGLILQARDADVLRVEYAYPKTDFQNAAPAGAGRLACRRRARRLRGRIGNSAPTRRSR